MRIVRQLFVIEVDRLIGRQRRNSRVRKSNRVIESDFLCGKQCVRAADCIFDNRDFGVFGNYTGYDATDIIITPVGNFCKWEQYCKKIGNNSLNKTYSSADYEELDLDALKDFIDSKVIVKRYLTSWFVLDVITALPYSSLINFYLIFNKDSFFYESSYKMFSNYDLVLLHLLKLIKAMKLLKISVNNYLFQQIFNWTIESNVGKELQGKALTHTGICPLAANERKALEWLCLKKK